MTPEGRSLTHLQMLESEAIHVMREVAAELERPVLLFSGGKDSIVLLRLAEKPSVGQRHVFLNPRRAADIHALIDRGVLPRAAAALLVLVQLAHLAFGLSPKRARAHGETLFTPEFWLERVLLAAQHVSEDVVPRALLGLNGATEALERGPRVHRKHHADGHA